MATHVGVRCDCVITPHVNNSFTRCVRCPFCLILVIAVYFTTLYCLGRNRIIPTLVAGCCGTENKLIYIFMFDDVHDIKHENVQLLWHPP